MLTKNVVFLAAATFISGSALAETAKPSADAHAQHGHAAPSGDQMVQVRAILKNIVDDNDKFVRMHKQAYFEPFIKKQSPRATVVTCADSRVHSQALDATPDGDLFFVRNIGNQLATTEGSIEYGVEHLNTPVLLFIGHVSCGAIQAATGDYAMLSAPIKRELDTLKIKKGGDLLENVRLNVNNQVSDALRKFASRVDAKQLVVVGAVYDFADALHHGYGRLEITNINGETDPAKIKRTGLIKL